MAKQNIKQRISGGRAALAVIGLLLLLTWSGFAVFKTIPSNIRDLSKTDTVTMCHGHPATLSDGVNGSCRQETSAMAEGSRAAAITNIALDLVGVGLLVYFGPKLWAIIRGYQD